MKMKTLQDPQDASEANPSSQSSDRPQSDQQSNPESDAPISDLAGASISRDGNNKVSREDIELVQNLIERCLLLYMDRNEVVSVLKTRAKIEPGFTSLVWQKLEEENAEFFREYYIRLKLKKQILLFNNLLEHQYHLMKHTATPKVPLVPVQNANNPPMGYPVMQQPAMPTICQPHLDSTGLANGVPSVGNAHQMGMNSGNGAMCYMPEMGATSNGHLLPLVPSNISGIDMDSVLLDHAFPADLGTTGGLNLAIDGGAESSKDMLRSDGQLTWNFGSTDAADLTNSEDLRTLGTYNGSPFLDETDIMLETDHDFVEEFFVDDMPSSQSDEEK